MHTFADRHPQFVLEDVRVPAAAILGAIGEADELTNEWFVEERIHIGARCSGAMERLLTLAVEWATERVQFGERIYDFQGVSFPLADSAADASAARLADPRDAPGSSTRAPIRRSSTPRRRSPSCSRPRRPSAAPTGSSRSSAAAATCASSPPSGSSASSGSTGSGRARARSSGWSSPGRSRSAASSRVVGQG